MDGYILIHGKNTGPRRPDCAMGVLARKLEQHSLVDYRIYPWEWNNLYFDSFESSFDRIVEARNKLLTRGATHIHLVGHSLGGNAVLHYASRSTAYSTLMLLAPAHNTEIPFINWLTNWSISEARRAIKSGQGDQQMPLIDFNVDRVYTYNITPHRYINFFSKEGPANMTESALKITNRPHVYCIIPTDDSTQNTTVDYVWNRLQVSEQSVMVRPEDTHNGAARNYHDDLVKWVDNLKSTNLI